MKRTIKTSDVHSVYPALATIKYPKGNKKAFFALMRNADRLRPIYEGYQKFFNDVRVKCQPDDFDSFVEKFNNRQNLPPAERAAVEAVAREMDRNLEECVKPRYEEEHTVDLDPLSEDDIYDIAAVNDFTGAIIMTLRDIFLFSPEEQPADPETK